ncbi:MAG: aminodeoxychorismate/anthranilate synthase component II [Pseudomonadota bacterium]
MILVIDNYDSFVHNLARYIRLAGGTTRVVRNDAAPLNDLLALNPTAVVLSPGPKAPAQAGVCLSLIKALPPQTPVLGVCLGHQCLVEAFGGETVRAREPQHGLASAVTHDGKGVFAGIENPCAVGRYHSLISTLPPDGPLQACAMSAQGEVMAVRHRTRPLHGVQFHPESVLTPSGRKMISNFLKALS